MSILVGILFAVFTSLLLPIAAFSYAIASKRWLPFLLGVLAFSISQLLLRIPLLDLLQKHSTTYILIGSTKPILFALILGFSAGIFEELARYLLMKFFMKKKDWTSGFIFGLGHGGVEAVLFLGLGALTALFSPVSFIYGGEYFLGGAERFFAITLHISLSIIVLRSVVERRIVFLIVAILIHGITNSLIGIIPQFMKGSHALITLELVFAVTAFITFIYSLIIKRKGILR